MPGGIVPVLCLRQPVGPMLRVVLSKTTQIVLEAFVHHFRLTVSLRVVTSAQFKGCALESEQLPPKQASKRRVPVGDNGLGHAMEFENSVDEELCDLSGCVGVRE